MSKTYLYFTCSKQGFHTHFDFRFRMADIKEYMDNKSQAKIVQIIIENVETLFGPQDQYYSSRPFKNDNSEIDELKIGTK